MLSRPDLPCCTGKPPPRELGDGSALIPAADGEATFAFLKAYLPSQTTEY